MLLAVRASPFLPRYPKGEKKIKSQPCGSDTFGKHLHDQMIPEVPLYAVFCIYQNSISQRFVFPKCLRLLQTMSEITERVAGEAILNPRISNGNLD